jgi:hypothetical protein
MGSDEFRLLSNQLLVLRMFVVQSEAATLAALVEHGVVDAGKLVAARRAIAEALEFAASTDERADPGKAAILQSAADLFHEVERSFLALVTHQGEGDKA